APEAPRPDAVYPLAPDPVPAPPKVHRSSAAGEEQGGGSGRRRKKQRRAACTPPNRDRVFLPLLAGVAGVWLVLGLISLFFRINSSVGMATLGFGLMVFLVSWLWLAIIGTRDGISWWYFLPRFRGYRMSAITEYARQNPGRAGTPFWLAMQGVILILLTFA